VWNDKDYPSYRDHSPRFVVEFGFQAPPTWATFQRALAGGAPDRALSIDDPGVRYRQRAFGPSGGSSTTAGRP